MKHQRKSYEEVMVNDTVYNPFLFLIKMISMSNFKKNKPNFKRSNNAAALDRIGRLIDEAYDTRSTAKNDQAFTLLSQLQARELSSELAALVHYFKANAWQNRFILQEKNSQWDWEQPEIQQQILELRRAVTHTGFKKLDKLRQCQIFTNLANQLNTVGRTIEAIQIWDRALKLIPRFGMALGNRGYGLQTYGYLLYDPGHRGFVFAAASNAFTAAEDGLYESPDYEHAKESFKALKKQVASYIDEHVDIIKIKKINNQHYSLGKGSKEQSYRRWCLFNGLFLNPLNDLGTQSVAARDVLGLPTITESSPSALPPAVFGFFNQIKQEFVSARHLYHEGLHSEGVHYSDRDVFLTNTLDYPSYSLAAEKIRIAFRISYSLLDKIGFFINDYYDLKHNPKRVSFRTVWYESKGSEPRPLLNKFVQCQNLPLRGLFWLSKDMFDENFQDCTEPDAAQLSDIRNHLEHKYLQLHHDFGSQALKERTSDNLGYRLTANDFAARTLRLLKLARAAIIYLSLSIHCEERLRNNGNSDGKETTLSMKIDTWDDDWKRLDL